MYFFFEFTNHDDNLLPKLSQNLLEILHDDEFYDITIESIFRAHMVILYYRSPYLQRILLANKKIRKMMVKYYLKKFFFSLYFFLDIFIVKNSLWRNMIL